MEYVIGEKYLVPCAEIIMDDGRHYDIPVFEHLHADAQFGFPHHHYHIDGRFEIHPRMVHWLNIKDGRTATIIAPEVSNSFSRIVKRELKCIGLHTGLSFPEESPKLASYREWYKNYIGQKCAGKKCPHFGTEMIEEAGLLICPMHGLTADLATSMIVASDIL